MKRIFVTAIAALVCTGCVQVEEKDVLIPGKTTIYTGETNYATGGLGAIGENYADLGLEISSDPLVVVQKDELYVLERNLENVLKVSPQGTVLYTTKLKSGFNPHDVAVLNSTKGYICSNILDEIALFNPTTGDTTGSIDISAYAHDSVSTNATKMVIIGSNLYVVCQMRAPYTDKYNPGDGSLILKIDTNTDKVIDTISCAFENASDLDQFNGNLVVTSGASWGGSDGGVELVNLATKNVTTLVSGEKLGFDIAELAIDEKRGEIYGSLYRGWGDAPIVRYDMNFDPIDTLAGIVQAACPIFDPLQDQFYVAEVNSFVTPKVIVWNPLTGAKKEFETELPVQSMTFVTSMVSAK